MDVNLGVKFSDIEECAEDIAEYVSQEGRWPDPILTGSAECEAMVLMNDKFLSVSSQWICPQSKHVGKWQFRHASRLSTVCNNFVENKR
jgi:hypothetical protein